MHRITVINSFYSFLKLLLHVTRSLTWSVLLKIIFSHQILFAFKSYFDSEVLNLRWWELDFWHISSRGMFWQNHERWKCYKAQTYLVIQLWWCQMKKAPESLQFVALLLKLPSNLTFEVTEYTDQTVGNRKPLGLWNHFIEPS